MSVAATLTERSFEVLNNLLVKRTGVRLSSAFRSVLSSRLGERIEELKLSNVGDYIETLLSDELSDELGIFFDLVVPHESYFLREIEALEWAIRFLEDSKCTNPIIWSAGCAHGQEPLSLLMLALEAELQTDAWQVIGTDLGPRTVEIARAACYTRSNLRDVPDALADRHFEWDPEIRRFRLFGELAERVDYHLGNILVGSDTPTAESCDLVLCRNVLLYFDHAARPEALRNLAASLKPGGALILGVTENLPNLPDNLEAWAGARVRVLRRK